MLGDQEGREDPGKHRDRGVGRTVTKSERLVRREIKLSEKLLQRVEDRIKRDGFTSFNELVRFALQRILESEGETEK